MQRPPSLSPPPYQSPPFDIETTPDLQADLTTGHVTGKIGITLRWTFPWLQQLNQNLKAAQGVQGLQNDSGMDTAEQRDIEGDARQAAELAKDAPARDFTPDVERLKAELAVQLSPRDFTVEIEDLRRQVALIPEPVAQLASGLQAIVNTHAHRLANYPATANPNALFIETDRNNLVYYSDGSNWIYIAGQGYGTMATRWADLGTHDDGAEYVVPDSDVSFYTKVLYRWSAGYNGWVYQQGTYRRLQSELAALAATLGNLDAGLTVDVTDYAHILEWAGTVWEYHDPSDPAGEVRVFKVDPAPTTGWHLCDGTAAVPYLKSDGTLGTEDLDDLVSDAAHAAYLKMGSPASTPNAATAPGFTVGAGSQFPTATPTGAGSVDATGQPRNVVYRPWFRQ